MAEQVELRAGGVDVVALRAARRLHAALMLATTPASCEALLTGRPVPPELLNPRLLALLPVWGGFLDDAAALDVEIAHAALRAGRQQRPRAHSQVAHLYETLRPLAGGGAVGPERRPRA